MSLTPHELARNQSGTVRWETLERWYSVDCTKVGYLEKSGGYWMLTPAGCRSAQASPGELIRSAGRMYRQWKSKQAVGEPDSIGAEGEGETVERQAVYEQAIETARAGIEEHINALGSYDFQNLVADLLRAMGYHVPHVAAPGFPTEAWLSSL